MARVYYSYATDDDEAILAFFEHYQPPKSILKPKAIAPNPAKTNNANFPRDTYYRQYLVTEEPPSKYKHILKVDSTTLAEFLADAYSQMGKPDASKGKCQSSSCSCGKRVLVYQHPSFNKLGYFCRTCRVFLTAAELSCLCGKKVFENKLEIAEILNKIYWENFEEIKSADSAFVPFTNLKEFLSSEVPNCLSCRHKNV